MLKTKQFYIDRQGILVPEEVEVDFSGLTKLSLLKKIASHEKSEIEIVQKHFLTMIKIIKSDVFFRYEIKKDIILWELFAKEKEITEFILNEVKNVDYDYILWPKEHLTPPKLIVFDMDSTFIQIEVIDELAKKHGVGDLVSSITEAAMKGELDFSESLISRVSCLKGLKQSHIKSICQSLPLSLGVDELVKQSKNVKVAIVSGGFTPFVEHLKKTMSLYKVKANDLEIENQALTGKVLGKIVDAKEKAVFIQELQKELRLSRNDIMAIGDGANDLLMMEQAGFSLAYRAKPTVQAKAKGIMNTTHLNHLLNVFDFR